MRGSILRLCLLTSLVLAVGLSVASAAEWADLKGRFVYDGTPPVPKPLNVNKDVEHFGKLKLVDESLVVGDEGGLANVVVYVRNSDVPVHPDYDESADDVVSIDNKGGRFVPRVVPVRLTQTLAVLNSDPCAHNSNLQPLGDTGINPLLSPNSSVEHKFNRKQIVPMPVSCNIHPWMKGYVLPRDNPYTAVTAADGTFTIEKLPAGTELEFQIWQEKSGYLTEASAGGKPVTWDKGRMTLTLKPGENDLSTIKISPKQFEK